MNRETLIKELAEVGAEIRESAGKDELKEMLKLQLKYFTDDELKEMYDETNDELS